jgi:two-component system, sensor histidine kinase and response regulator
MLWEKADDATLLNQVAALEESAVRLNNIVEELLLLAGVRRQSVQPVPVDMAAVVRESLGRVEHLVAKSGAQVEQPRDWPVALGYPPWIAEVMTNYLSNAIKYGGQPPLITLGGELVAERKMVRYWVSDNGAGLSAEQQSKLFQQFSRIAGTRAKGHGLGLSIVRRITEKLHGAAGVESSPGRGSRFWFELPSAG